MWRWGFLVVLVAAGSACYAPQPSAGAPCGPGDSCPSGLSCVDGRCVAGGSSTIDGGSDIDSGVDPTECTGLPDGMACGNATSSECNAPDTCAAEVCTSNEALDGAACYDCAAGSTQCATCAQGACPDGACEPNGKPTAAELTSPRVAGYSNQGNMFDVVAAETITITSFETHVSSGTTDYEIWTKAGTYVGFDDEPSAWMRVGAATFDTAGLGAFTQIPIPVNITIAAGQRRAFYLTNKQLNNRYHDGTQVGAPLVSTPQLTLYEGAGVTYGTNGFSGNINTPRAWEGVIRYRRGGGQTLASPMAGGIASDGVMFTVTPARDLEVSLLGVHLAQGTHDVTVYFRRGTFVGAEIMAAEWKPLATANNVVSAGASTTTFLPVTLDLFLEGGTTTAFYVVTSVGALRSQPKGGGTSAASNADLAIGHGVTVTGEFGAVGTAITPNVELGYGACN